MKMKKRMLLSTVIGSFLLHGCGGGGGSAPELATITNGIISVTANLSQFAGAIQSIIFNGREFVNRFDHGRLFQTAFQVDGYGECFNPTEAGCLADVGTDRSSSKLLGIEIAEDNSSITTHVQAASWATMPDGSAFCDLGIHPKITIPTSGFISKRVELFHNEIHWHLTVECPEVREAVDIEILTGYLPAEFSNLWEIHHSSKKLSPVTNWRLDGENDGYPDGSTLIANFDRRNPIIWSTADGLYAVGILRPTWAVFQCEEYPRYEALKFSLGSTGPDGNSCSKFSVVSRLSARCFGGKKSFVVELIYGMLGDVRDAIARKI